MEHPAIQFGHWLKARRRKTLLVARVFAGQVGLSPAQYAELEAGVVRWLQKDQEQLVPDILELSPEEIEEFARALQAARNATPLELCDIFSREQLEPVRARSDESQLTMESRAAIVEAVFRPLT